jgi:putative membrane protein
MVLSEQKGFRELVRFWIPYFLGCFVYGCFFIIIEFNYSSYIHNVPSQIGNVLGLAIAFFLGFRMNSAYDRWWEARKIIGEMGNTSRAMFLKIVLFVSDSSNLKEEYQNKNADLSKEFLMLFKNYFQAISGILTSTSTARPELKLYLILQRFKQVCKNENSLPVFDIYQLFTHFSDAQGRAERIKNTPFLKVYAAFTRVLIIAYIIFIPLFVGEIHINLNNFNWIDFISIPILALISSVFMTINKLAILFGEPFSFPSTAIPVEEILSNTIIELEQLVPQGNDK